MRKVPGVAWVLLAWFCVMLTGCSETQAPEVCPEVGFFVGPDGELVQVYTTGPEFGAQGVVLRPGECVTVKGIPE